MAIASLRAPRAARACMLVTFVLASAGSLGCRGGDGSDPGDGSGSSDGADEQSEASTGGDATSGGPDDGADETGSEGGGPPQTVCEAPMPPYDTTNPTVVIGDGTAESCAADALASAAAAGGTIVFDCGPDPVTIALSAQVVLPVDRDTIIDGGGLITLDGQGMTRHFIWDHPDFMNNPNKIVLQRLKLIGGAAPLGQYFPQDANNPACAYGYKDGSGGSLYVRNGRVHIIDCEFVGNVAALEGPDVGGGAIYALGVPEILISGSTFRDNRGANGGAVGLLFANPAIYNSVFEGNTAEGIGQNYVEPGCPNFNHDAQGGAGGNSGAISFDGLNDEGVTYEICGSVFRDNGANELGGALFRTPNAGSREILIDRCIFDGNTARLGGVSFIRDNTVTVRDSTFMHNRAGVDLDGNPVQGGLGGLWINTGSIDAVNSTFYDNVPSGLDVENGGGTVRNTTFVGSPASGAFMVDNSLMVETTCNAPLGGGVGNVGWPDAASCVSAAAADPGIGEIADNGGPTPTFLPTGDAVLGVGTNCPSADQRGEPRNTGSCAAGSVEP